MVFGGIFVAFIIATYMVYNYGPTGRYLAQNVLLSPLYTEKLSYNDVNPKTGGTTRFVFDRIEFAFYDAVQKQWRKIAIDSDHYQKFYDLVAGEQSLQELSSEIEALFSRSNGSTLTLTVKTESNAKLDGTTKVFQQVQFVNAGNYYRVQLHETNPSGRWAYFYHKGIYDAVQAMFFPKDHS